MNEVLSSHATISSHATTPHRTRESMPRISVIIVNYNAGALLNDCVKSALGEAVEVIIVDNDSYDSSIDLLTTRFPLSRHPIQLIVNESNVGFAAACNIGAKAAKGDYLLFLNPDCKLDPNALPALLKELESSDDIGMVGGLLVDPDGTEQGGGRRAVPTPWRSFVRAFGLARFADRWPDLFFDFHLHKQPLPEQSIEVEAISGACMLIRRQALQDVGPWDEGYFLHCEDLDWCMRFRRAGWKIKFVPDARVVHHQGTCSRTRPFFVEWHKHRGMIRFYRKFFREDYPGALMLLVSLGVWLRFGAVAAYHASAQTVSHIKGITWPAEQPNT